MLSCVEHLEQLWQTNRWSNTGCSRCSAMGRTTERAPASAALTSSTGRSHRLPKPKRTKLNSLKMQVPLLFSTTANDTAFLPVKQNQGSRSRVRVLFPHRPTSRKQLPHLAGSASCGTSKYNHFSSPPTHVSLGGLKEIPKSSFYLCPFLDSFNKILE